ncbi:MAG: hypothetical protein ACLPID_19175 [Beijerinckiaceae bacterium]
MQPRAATLERAAPCAKQVLGYGERIGLRLSRARDTLGLALSRGTIFLPVIAAAIWALAHPYPGIVGDASLYIGRALADLDPQGLGQDLLFAHDGQSRFSIYPIVAKWLVIAIGTDRAALTLVVSSMFLWVAALAVLARRFLTWRHIWVVIVFVAVLPVNYGAPQRFGFSEIIAVPRPMAEALVLLALAAFAYGRTYLTFAILAAATLIHPLMALAGWTAVGLALCLEDRRWWIAAGAGTSIVISAAILGVPLVDRLVLAIAPDIKAFAASRSPLLFPTHWPIEFLGPIIAQIATIAVAASLFQGRQRRLLLATTAVGLFGIGVQALFGDILSSLLVIQAQCWRMAWLTAAIGSFALALCALELWRRDAIGRVVLALLVMSWIASSEPSATAMLAGAALVLQFTKNRFNWPVSTLSVVAIWAVACLVALLANLHYFINYAEFLVQRPAEAPQGIGYFWNERYIAFPICAFALALTLPQRDSRVLWGFRCSVAALLVAAGVWLWDDRTTLQRMVDTQDHPPELMHAIAGRSGSVLWIGGLQEAWYLTGRPQWASPLQGVAAVFSRDLAIAWRDRMVFLRDEGLADRNVLSSLAIPSSAELAHLSEAGITHLCARPDAPAWIIAPLETGVTPLAERQAQIWHLPQPQFKMTDEGNSYVWHRIQDFLVLSCAAQ